MAISTVIPRERPDHPSLDYELLRNEGIQHLENLATEIWTDFNAHDPGITLLELLSYAITDLGYRTRKIPIGDLLAGGTETAFFQAIDILTCAPVTARDYRKLMIDVPGIKNAWIEKYTSPILFSEKGKDYGICWEGKFVFPYLGAYDENTNTWVPYAERVEAFLLEYYGEQLPPTALSCLDNWIKNGVEPTKCACLGIETEVFTACLANRDCPPLQNIEEKDTGEKCIEPGMCELLHALMCKYGVASLVVDEIETIKEIITDGSKLITYQPVTKTDWEVLTLNGLARIKLDLNDDVNPDNKSQVQPIVDRVMQVLNCNRFLCHDYVQPPLIVKRKPISICLHIEVKGGKDINEVAAESIWEIEQLLTPTARFYTFQEMLDKGYRVEDIYNGPLLDHGFLDNEELDKAQLLKVFRHSDITNAVTTLDDVLNVRELKFKLHPQDNQFKIRSSYTIFDCDDEPMRPFIDLCKSCIYVTQNGRRCEIKESAVIEALKLKRLMAECHDTPGGLGLPGGIPRPDLTDYLSLQYDLPEVYSVGNYYGKKDPPFYKKRARRQLQSYLAFFDQILAAYLLQLGEVRKLFAVEQDTTQPTYQTPDLSEIPGMNEIIYKEEVNDAENIDRTFTVESDATRMDRRNRLLDHMIARFGESFSEYVATLASSCKGAEEEDYEVDLASLLRSKALFLKELSILGHDRGRAYCYRGKKGKKVWNTDNVAGIKKRVHRKLGLNGSWNEMSLRVKPPYILGVREIRGARGAIRYQVSFRALPENLPQDADFPFKRPLLFGPKHSTRRAAQNKRSKLNSKISDASLYSLGEHPNDSSQYTVLLTVDGKVELHGEEMSESEATILLECIQDLVAYEPENEKEGFHVLEHILLRPNDTDDQLLNLALGCEPQYTPPDPYSNWLTVVLPNWSKKMRNRTYQQHVEQVFRQEMPAEAMVRFCWLGKDEMKAFEERYRIWLEALAACQPDDCQITPVANDLIKWLNEHPCSCNCNTCCKSDSACEDCKDCQ